MAPFQTGSVLHLLSSRSGGRTVLLNLSEQRSGHVDGSRDSGIIARKKINKWGIYSGVKANVCSGSVPTIQIHKLRLFSFVFILWLTFFRMQAPPWPQCYLQNRDRQVYSREKKKLMSIIQRWLLFCFNHSRISDKRYTRVAVSSLWNTCKSFIEKAAASTQQHSLSQNIFNRFRCSCDLLCIWMKENCHFNSVFCISFIFITHY